MKFMLRPGRYYVRLLIAIFLIVLCSVVLLLAFKLRYSSAYRRSVDNDLVDKSPLRARSSLNKDEQYEYFMFLAILSSPASTFRRKAARNTWLKIPYESTFSVRHRFVVGTLNLGNDVKTALGNENQIHDDLLILEDLQDSYSSLTLKLLKILQWVSLHVKTHFFMKADDDSFVRLSILLNDLAEKEYLGRIYWGFFRGNSNVKRAGPWAEKSWYLCDHYLPYALGGGYVLSSDLVAYVNSIAHMVQLYNSEDVSLGTWLAPVRLNRIHDVRFDTEYKSRGCNNKHIVSHKQSVSDLKKKYDSLIKDGKLCAEEHSTRLSFEYNWEALPSKCCLRKKGIP